MAFPDNLFDNPLYLGITIGADAEMIPRLKLSSVPSAFIAEDLVACAAGQTNCDGICADLQTDPANCGGCGVQCGVGQICLNGSCTTDPDADGDGFTVGQGDCNDADASIYPGAPELCDGKDNDCDSQTDNGADASCNDSNACTVDVCAGASCQSTPVSCDDADACTVDICDPLSGCVFTPVSCDDGNECTVDACDAVAGCVNSAVANGTPCTGGTCNNGICQ